MARFGYLLSIDGMNVQRAAAGNIAAGKAAFVTGEFPLPTIAVLVRGGETRPILRKDWNSPLGDDDAVLFIPQLQGGGDSKNPLATVLSIALLVVAPYAVGAIGGALQVATVAAGGGLTMAGQFIMGAVLIGGSKLIQAIAPLPKSSVQQASDIKQASPTYNLQAQGNTARIGSPYRKVYGKCKVFGDIASVYSFYNPDNDEQTLNMALIIGHGKHTIHKTLIGESNVEGFAEAVRYCYVYHGANDNEVLSQHNGAAMVRPSYPQGLAGRQTPGLITSPYNVVYSSEVSGQELLASNEDDYPADGWVGGFVVQKAGLTASTYEVDLEATLFYTNDDSSFAARSVDIEIQFRTIDDDGNALTGWDEPALVNGHLTLTAASNQLQRYTFAFMTKQTGRHEVRMRRTNIKDMSVRGGHSVKWTALKAFLNNKSTKTAGLTMLYMQMQATDKLYGAANRKVSSVVTGWDYAYIGMSWVHQENRNPWWAAMDILRSIYGGQLSDDKIQLAKVVEYAAKSAENGDCFDYLQEQTIPVGDALSTCLEVLRGSWYQRAGKIRFNVDEPKTDYAFAVHDGNTIAGSISLKYMTATDDTTDSINAEYWDNKTNTWAETGNISPLSNPVKPAKIRLEGVTDAQRATALAMYKARNNIYRRIFIETTHEMEGFSANPGDKVAIALTRVNWGQQADIEHVEIVNTGRVLVYLSAPLKWDAGQQHYAGFSTETGGFSALYPVEQMLAASDVLVLSGLPSVQLRDMHSPVPTRVMFGSEQAKIVRDGLVITATPQDSSRVRLSCVIDHPGVYG